MDALFHIEMKDHVIYVAGSYCMFHGLGLLATKALWRNLYHSCIIYAMWQRISLSPLSTIRMELDVEIC